MSVCCPVSSYTPAQSHTHVFRNRARRMESTANGQNDEDPAPLVKLLKEMLNGQMFSGLFWKDQENKIFKLRWIDGKKSKEGDEITEILRYIAQTRYQGRSLPDVRRNFRNSLGTMTNVFENLTTPEDRAEGYRVYKIHAKQTRRKSSKEDLHAVQDRSPLSAGSHSSPKSIKFPSSVPSRTTTSIPAHQEILASSQTEVGYREENFRSRSPVREVQEPSETSRTSSAIANDIGISQQQRTLPVHQGSISAGPLYTGVNLEFVNCPIACQSTATTMMNPGNQRAASGPCADSAVWDLESQQQRRAVVATTDPACSVSRVYPITATSGMTSTYQSENQTTATNNLSNQSLFYNTPDAATASPAVGYGYQFPGADATLERTHRVLLEVYYWYNQVEVMEIDKNIFTVFHGKSCYTRTGDCAPVGEKIVLPDLDEKHAVGLDRCTQQKKFLQKTLSCFKRGVTIIIENDDVFVVRRCKAKVAAKVFNSEKSKDLKREEKTHLFNVNDHVKSAFQPFLTTDEPTQDFPPQQNYVKCRLSVGVTAPLDDNRRYGLDIEMLVLPNYGYDSKPKQSSTNSFDEIVDSLENINVH